MSEFFLMLHIYSKSNVKDVNLDMENSICFPVFNLFHKGPKWLTHRLHLENYVFTSQIFIGHTQNL